MVAAMVVALGVLAGSDSFAGAGTGLLVVIDRARAHAGLEFVDQGRRGPETTETGLWDALRGIPAIGGASGPQDKPWATARLVRVVAWTTCLTEVARRADFVGWVGLNSATPPRSRLWAGT